jgi:hypothetical protein
MSDAGRGVIGVGQRGVIAAAPTLHNANAGEARLLE